jgi:hypothetical protein
LSTPLTETEVLQACQTLFGSETNVCRGFLSYLQPGGAKSAFRKIAKETHPDLFAREASHVQMHQTALFQEVRRAYEIITLFFKQRDEGSWGPRSRADDAEVPRREYRHTRTDSRSKEPFHAGGFARRLLPFHCLELGRFLYYQGIISYEELISALVWQRGQRPIIGDIALRWGWLNTSTIERILGAITPAGRFGEKAVNLGLLSLFQVNTLLYYQRSQQERLGKYFVEKNILTPEILEHMVRKLNEHNAAVRCEAVRTGRMRRTRA